VVLRPGCRISAVVFLACYLAGCTAVVDSAVEGRYAQYNYSTDWAKNEAILLNIVRASESQPLNFMSFQPYQGTASVTGAASSPSFIIGPARSDSQKQYTFGQGTLTASASGTGTVTVTTLDTQNFYEAVLAPVDFKDLYHFQSQGYPRELLFRLFTEYVSLIPAEGDPHGTRSIMISNDPSPEKRCFPPPPQRNDIPTDPITICFEDLVDFALLSGLSSEIRTIPNPAADAKQGSDSGSNSKTEGRLCFDPALANRAYLEYQGRPKGFPRSIRHPKALHYVEYHPICGVDKWIDTTPKPSASASTSNSALATAQKNLSAALVAAAKATPDQKTVAQAKVDAAVAAYEEGLAGAKTDAASTKTGSAASRAPGTKPGPGLQTLKVITKIPTGNPIWDRHINHQYTVVIGTRSTFSMYNFLGRLLNKQSSEANTLIGPLSEDYDRRILTVIKGQPIGCFVSAVFNIGVFCVPIEGAQNTKSAFSILSQLLALKTTTGDLQLLPTIRLLPTN
jgi:hypothetical protein